MSIGSFETDASYVCIICMCIYINIYDLKIFKISQNIIFPRNLIGEVCVLEDMTTHVPVIEIRIEECRGNGT